MGLPTDTYMSCLIQQVQQEVDSDVDLCQFV